MEILQIQKGNPVSTVIAVTDESGNPYDLTGKTVFFTVKNITDETADDLSALITKAITVHTDATNGITTLELTAVQTNIAKGNYKWDLRIYDDSPLVQLNSYTEFCEVVDVVTKRIA